MIYHMIASGSKGNVFVLENGESKLLIDCGTTQRNIKNNLNKLNIELDDLDCVLITHDHSDHISAINLFKNHPVYSPIGLNIETMPIIPYQTFKHGSFTITPIATSHDTIDSVGYIIEDTDHKLVYITDTGYIRNEDLNLLLDADIIVLESNHDPKMLMDSKRPYYIKQRILSDTGHLSNDKAGTILAQIVSDNTQEVVLAHLSDEANTEELAFDTVSRYLNGFKGRLKVGKQHEVVSGKIKG